MINFQDEIKRFKPSLEVENIEEAITGMDLTDMSDMMMQLMKQASEVREAREASRRAVRVNDSMDDL